MPKFFPKHMLLGCALVLLSSLAQAQAQAEFNYRDPR